MPRSTERAMLGCFPVPAVRRPTSPPPSYEEGSPSAGTGSASTSSPAILDDDVLYSDDAEAEAEADAGRLSTAIASRRFFLASPGRSNSIVDSAEHPHGRHSVSNARALRRAATSAFPAAANASSPATKQAPFRGRGDEDMQQVRKVSVSTDAPRADFLKSMVEMVGALGLDPRRRDADLARLHDLLLCYIALNERDALRDILGAFADLMCLLDGNSAAATATADDGATKRDANETDQTGG
ncbi:transcription repressor OFP16-like [Phragmites australis]|uniref:transcription repressor OFP16-like n=1 Tax=Phragmites australis TaxID=29695 RepID=UPI002D794FEB|nr:transcription repressor OFP16-like [Phragmites australis]